MCKSGMIKMNNEEEIQHPVQTVFGLIPEMPMKLAKSEVVIISIRKIGEHQPHPVNVCMPHQLYVEKLKRYFEEGAENIYIYPAKLGMPVKRDGKKVWIEKRDE